ncbi:MAG: IS110 family transposase [Chitinophagaceae bacterium]|nr:IS110 family transposase [Chitinophagaceae bacterium]
MRRILKQVAGIDIAQKDFVVCLGRIDDLLCVELYARKTFANTAQGFEQLRKWVGEKTLPDPEVLYVMEATGVYHESLAYYLNDQSCQVSVVLPNRISSFFKTLQVKTQTDRTMAEAIAQFGLEKRPEVWTRPKKVFRDMRQLTRERDQLVQTRTMVKNQQHAEESEAFPNPGTLKRLAQQIELLNEQENEIKAEIAELIKQDEQVKALIKLICSIPGIGKLTASIILAETNGFELIRNKRQLASYAGLDVLHKESGTSVHIKPRISKKGNKFLRKAMHLPALAASRHSERFKAIFARHISKHGISMKATVAVQRKLLEMAFSIYKTNVPYDPEYLKKLESSNRATL